MLPKDILKVLLHLESKKITAFVVGGAVRDSLLSKKPDDYDIAAECTPDELCRAFEGWQYYDGDVRFGTLTVNSGERNVEITCCRSEGTYSDLRRPDIVEFCRDIVQDLKRRDFTVNAMAMDRNGEIIDPYGGRVDLEAGLIRCVGEAERRFSEDALRIIRAVRFASSLGFEIEERTKSAVLEKRELLLSVASERIFTELKKLLMGDGVFSALMEYSQVICTIIPELSPSIGFCQNNPHHIYTVYEHIARTVQESPKDDVNIRLCMLFHDIAKPEKYFTDEKGIGHFYGHPERSAEMAKTILRRLKADTKTIQDVSFLVKYHDTRPEATRRSIHKYLKKVGINNAKRLIHVRRADLLAQSPEYHYQFEMLSESLAIIEELEREGACVSISDLAVDGRDLIAIGIPEGPEIGKLLNSLLERVTSEKIRNEREALLSLAKKMIK